EQRVATGEHQDIHVRVAHEIGKHLRLVHPGTYGRDDTLPAQLLQGRVGQSQRIRQVIVGVMEINEIDTVEPEPPEALLERAQDPVTAEVPDAPMRRRHVEASIVASERRGERFEPSPNFRRYDVLLSLPLGKRSTEPALR